MAGCMILSVPNARGDALQPSYRWGGGALLVFAHALRGRPSGWAGVVGTCGLPPVPACGCHSKCTSACARRTAAPSRFSGQCRGLPSPSPSTIAPV